jgi:hypothetical protein
MKPSTFPVGFHHLHPDVSMNFQMNRWFSWVGEPGMLAEMRDAAARITNYGDWKREFLALAEKANADGHVLRAGFYFRAAGEVRGFLPAYRFTPEHPKGTIVFFGGFDSYIEELTSAFFYLRDAGYEVIAFEGPGQGGALHDAGLHMTPAWHQPVKAVLDYFKLDHVTPAGLSIPPSAITAPDNRHQPGSKRRSQKTLAQKTTKPPARPLLRAGLGGPRGVPPPKRPCGRHHPLAC